MAPTLTAATREEILAGAATDVERETLERCLPEADTDAPPSGETLKLMARYEKYGVRLESPEEVIDSRHGKYRVPGTGKKIRFLNYRAEIPVEWWPLLENHPEQLVQRGLVGRADRWTGLPPGVSGPQIHTGALSASVQRVNQAPLEGWDQATVREIVGWIAEGRVPDLEHAESYEKAHTRRKMVVRALVDAQLGEEVPSPPAEELAPSFHQPAPSGGEG